MKVWNATEQQIRQSAESSGVRIPSPRWKATVTLGSVRSSRCFYTPEQAMRAADNVARRKLRKALAELG